MSPRPDRVYEQLLLLTEKQERLAMGQERHNQLLDEHMRRTAALEDLVERVRAEISPLKTHVAIFGALGKGLSYGAAVAAIGTFLAKAAGWF